MIESVDELKGFGPTAEAPRLAAEARSVGRQNMTIQDWGSVGEIVAAVATIITLLYLSTQIRHSSKVAAAQSQRELLDTFQT